MSVRLLLLAFLIASPLLPAQIGGNGKDGPLTPTGNVTLDTAKNGGIFNFTRIRIPSGVTVTLTGANAAVLLSRGEVTIAGQLVADGKDKLHPIGREGTVPGPGGYPGGRGGNPSFYVGEDGKGPGGGTGGRRFFGPPNWQAGGSASHATRGVTSTLFGGAGSGKTYGAAYPFDLRGGSGGGGGAQLELGASYGGTGGGGAVAILADGKITLSGTISARGGSTAGLIANSTYKVHGGAGAGGAILLRSLRGVEVTNGASVLATGGWLLVNLRPHEKLGGDGFIRIDSYATPPVVLGKVEPKPLVSTLPALREAAPPRLGKLWTLSAAAVPGDIVGFYLSLDGAFLRVPPFGVLRLDLSTLCFLGRGTVHAGGIDPLAALSIPIPRDPRLANVRLHVQAFNHIRARTGRPILSNDLVTYVR